MRMPTNHPISLIDIYIMWTFVCATAVNVYINLNLLNQRGNVIKRKIFKVPIDNMDYTLAGVLLELLQ